jgi:hypothetical protein
MTKYRGFTVAAIVGLLGVCGCGNDTPNAPPPASSAPSPIAPQPVVPQPVVPAQALPPSMGPAQIIVGRTPRPAEAPTATGLAATPKALSPAGISERRSAWLTEPFRCRAISTVRFRRCRFEETDTGVRLKFNGKSKDVVCDDTEFDADGNPSQLVGCRSSWLRIPRNNPLSVDKTGNIWSGSTSGWRWKGGEKYCCPGLWIEAPASLKK